MMVDEALERLVLLAKQRGNFETGELWTEAQIHQIEGQLQRRLPVSWAKFFMTFGDGRFKVKGRAYFSNDAPECPSSQRFKTPDADPYCREHNFDVEFYPARKFLGGDPWGSAKDAFGGGWLEVGSKPDGDSLILLTADWGRGAPNDGEVAWVNHEIGLRTYRWPGLVEFWQHMFELDEETPEELKRKKP